MTADQPTRHGWFVESWYQGDYKISEVSVFRETDKSVWIKRTPSQIYPRRTPKNSRNGRYFRSEKDAVLHVLAQLRKDVAGRRSLLESAQKKLIAFEEGRVRQLFDEIPETEDG